MEKFKQIFVLIAVLAVIFINYLASKGYIGGVTPDVISNKYPTVITPAGYAFSIWGLIYIGLIAFSIFQAMPMQRDNFKKIRTPFLISCLANCVWIFLWHHEQIVASVCAMLVLLASLIAVNINLSAKDSFLARIPFGIYFGWICVATIANISICLSYLGMQTTLPTSILLTCILIIIAAILGILLRFKLPNAAFALAIAWAILAIALKNGSVTAISAVSAFSFMGLLIAALLPFIRLKDAKN